MDAHIESGAVKVIEIIGISQNSFDDAVQQGLEKAAKTIDGISGVEVMKLCAKVKNGKISEYHANMKIAFAVR